jgi:hypothetical protein
MRFYNDFNSRGGDNHYEDRQAMRERKMEEEAHKAVNFTRNTKGIETITLDEIENDDTLAKMNALAPATQAKLKGAGIGELFPVQ